MEQPPNPAKFSTFSTNSTNSTNYIAIIMTTRDFNPNKKDLQELQIQNTTKIHKCELENLNE